MGRAEATINTDNFLHNLSYLRGLCPEAHLVVMAKANAYGHGLLEMAQVYNHSPIIGVGIAALKEAVILRNNGFKKRIFLFGGATWLDEPKEIIRLKVTPIISSIEEAAALQECPDILNHAPFPVHLKIDSGFYRYGLMFDSLLKGKHDQLLHLFKDNKILALEGLATHFACADKMDTDFTSIQISRFNECIKYLLKMDLKFSIIHMANSAAILRAKIKMPEIKDVQYLMRPGLAAYGIDPILEDTSHHPLKPVLTLKAPIVARKTLVAGHGVGYGHTYKTNGTRELAIIAIGYADGLHRALAEKGFALVSGVKAPFRGSLSMDSLAIDVTDVVKLKGLDAAKVGIMATLLGEDGSEKVTASMLAKASGTIPFEILTSISARVTRSLK